jgi:CxxC motif-containing protein (DUF1111 family)
MPTLTTDADAPLPELQNQTFHPFTDLLLHNMGEGLADHRPDRSATGTEWRTPPLWGLGLVERVMDMTVATRRTRPVLWRGDPAARWRGGEGEGSFSHRPG